MEDSGQKKLEEIRQRRQESMIATRFMVETTRKLAHDGDVVIEHDLGEILHGLTPEELAITRFRINQLHFLAKSLWGELRSIARRELSNKNAALKLEVVNLWNSGETITAIKKYREAAGLSLVEARNTILRWVQE